MSTREVSRTLLTKNKKISRIAVGAVTVLAISAPALTAEAPKKDEVFKVTTAIAIPGAKLTTFDISWDDPVLKKYFLADRDNKAIDIVDTTTNSITQSAAVFGGIAGSGPNGVITVNHKEIWAGDGDSTVKVLDAASGAFIQAVSTGGKKRADELCFDPRDQLVVAGNNQESPSQFISVIQTKTMPYTVVNKIVQRAP